MTQDHILSFGPYRLDAANARLWCDTQPVRLTAKALQVLQYLAGRPGQLVTKDELFRAVWSDTVVSDATLASNIQAVRQVLNDDPRNPRYVETVYRQGFRFIGKVVSYQLSVISQDKVVSSHEATSVQSLGSGVQARNSEPAPNPQPLTPNLPLPDKPSIVVLPFVNLSNDPTQEYFSDGITEEITATLSRVSSLFVIARTSAFAYKGKGVKVQDISRELGVRYVLEGSVRKASKQLRVIAQLIDATNGEHLWAEHYNRPLQNIFAVHDDIVQKIVTTLKLQLTLQEQGYIVRKHTDSLEAYDAYLSGMEHFRGFSKEADAQARQMFEKAVALDPQYAEAYVGLGSTYYQDWVFARGTEPQLLERALTMAHKALARHDSLPKAHSLLSFIYVQQRQHALAIAEGERAIDLDPNNTDSYAGLGHVMIWAGRAQEAIGMVEQAMCRNPHYPPWYLFQLGWAYRLTGRYAEAVTMLKDFIYRSPNLLPSHFNLAFSYVCLWAYQQNTDAQALEQALAAAQRVLALDASDPFGHALLGYVCLWQKQYEQAITQSEKAIALNPNLADGYTFLAEALSRVGKLEDALRMVEQALRCKPWVVDEHLSRIGMVYYLAGKPEEAIAPLKQFLARYPHVLGAHLTLAEVYSELGKDAEARTEAAEVLRINPKWSLAVWKQRAPYKDPAMLERVFAALRKAGLK